MTKRLSTIGRLVGAMVAGALFSGCGTNNSGMLTGTGGSAGAGGSTQGTGGSTASGGSSASGGITTDSGGIASGGIASGGIGSGGVASGGVASGGVAAGGIALGGTGGKASGGIASGGVGSGGIASGGIASGGIASGGIASGGISSGGIGSGGIGSGGVASGGVASGGVAFGSARDAGETSPGGCPAGQIWCEGCTPGTGSCGPTCPGMVCPGVDAGCADGTCSRDAGPNDALESCSQVTTQTECDGRSDCHSVFVSASNCGCSAPGCCTHFSRCADGAHANCSGTAACKIATPYCETPYVLAYTNNCYEGCVQQSACAPATCPQTPPPSASACGGGSITCFYQDCAGTGLRTLAVCSGYAWTEQTAACAPVTCSAGGQTDDCAVGDACVITTSSGGAYRVTPGCYSGCGPGLYNPQCANAAGYNCYPTYSLTAGVSISCSSYSSCGQGQGGCV